MPLLNATGVAATAVTAATVTQVLSRLLILHQPPCGWSPGSGPAPAQPQCALPPHGAICPGFHLSVNPSTGHAANACIPGVYPKVKGSRVPPVSSTQTDLF